MCNVHFDADREMTRGGGGGFYLGGSDFIFFVMYCNFCFIMLPFSLFASVYFFILLGEGGRGLYHFKKKKIDVYCLPV